MGKSKKTIIVTGANGQLGMCLREIADKHPEYKFIFTDIEELDITDRSEVHKLFADENPEWVINAAAYTAVDKAEKEQEKARAINNSAVEILAEESKKVNAGFIHISTDYVFEGSEYSELKEEDKTNPQSVYGKTKLEGEICAQKNPKHIILRTSWLYSAYGNNFVKTMRRLGNEKKEIGVVADQWGSPTSAHDLAAAIMNIIKKPEYGIFHYSNQGTANWAIFAEKIMEYSGLECKVSHIETKDYPTAAKRPQFAILSKDKFLKTYKTGIPEWEESLEKVIEKLNNK